MRILINSLSTTTQDSVLKTTTAKYPLNKDKGAANMCDSKNVQPQSSNTSVLQARAKRGRFALTILLVGCFSAFASQSALSQTLAPPVQSVLSDTAQLGHDSAQPDAFMIDRSYTTLASSKNPNTSRDSGGSIHLGDSDEGTIINITEGEDRIIGEVPAGQFTSTNASQIYDSGPYGTPSSSMGGNGAYNGYASTGYGNKNPCCPENCHSYYYGAEAIYFRQKADESFTLSQGRFLGAFDYELGGRYTVGQMLDCTDAVEFVYTGPLYWNRGRIDNSSSNSLNSVFTTANAVGGYFDSQIDTFNGAQRHIEVESARLQSIEVNRRWFAWDIMSTVIGIRAIEYNNSLLFDSTDSDLNAGFFRTTNRNFLLGGQIGGDVFRPIGQRLSIGSRTRIGLFANFNKGETILANRGTYLLNTRVKDTDISGLLQYGLLGRYRLHKNMVVVGGYEAWILAGMATVTDQPYVPITPNTGLAYRSSDTLFFHGATAGFEFTY